MSTLNGAADLSSTLFGKTRRAVLSLLYGHSDQAFYLREIGRAAGGGLGAVQRELKQLSEAGIVRRTARGKQVYYQAESKCPIFQELKKLVIKTAGVGDVLRAGLTPLAGRISVAFVYGSIARSKEHRNSDVDLLVVGDVTLGEVVSALGQAQEAIAREVNPTVYPVEEFRLKLARGQHFLKTVIRGPKVFLIGDERELKRLAQKRLVKQTSK